MEADSRSTGLMGLVQGLTGRSSGSGGSRGELERLRRGKGV